jgi:hypothetical protein
MRENNENAIQFVDAGGSRYCKLLALCARRKSKNDCHVIHWRVFLKEKRLTVTWSTWYKRRQKRRQRGPKTGAIVPEIMPVLIAVPVQSRGTG